MFTTEYWYVVVGIVISVVLPILHVMLPTKRSAEILSDYDNSLLKYAKSYIILGLFSILAGLVIYASLPVEIDPPQALIAGYAFDSTLQKLKK